MLSSADKLDLIDALCVTAEAMGTTLTPNAAKTMADDLELFSVSDLVIALQSCRRELTGRLTLAAILQRAQAADGRPGKDEAWAIALTSSDESDTVVMTDEIQVALGAARPVLNLGDKVGARMAFIGAYERLIQAARNEAIPVNWHVSIGFDAGRRIEAINAAVQMKRIPQERGKLYLTDLNIVPVTQDGLAIAGLLSGKAAMPSPDVREKLKTISDSLKVKARQKEAVRAHQSRQVRKDLNDRINRQLELAAAAQKRAS